MISLDILADWRRFAPWLDVSQVEQDLILSRAIVELFSHPTIASTLAFRGGTSLYKLHTWASSRYSEDLDLVQLQAGGIGPVLDSIHQTLDGWLGKPQWKRSEGRVTLNYRFDSADVPPVRSKLKIEINSREHFTVYGLRHHTFEVSSRWFSGSAQVASYELDELLGTKLRALYQRKKGRDLFDLSHALQHQPVSPDRILGVFAHYMQYEGARITRAMFEQNLEEKKHDARFNTDMTSLLSAGQRWSFDEAYERVCRELITRLPGDPWRPPRPRDPDAKR